MQNHLEVMVPSSSQKTHFHGCVDSQAMKLFSYRGVTGLPDISPFNNKLFCFLKKIKDCLTKQAIFLLNGDFIWQASDSPLTKELHGLTVSFSTHSIGLLRCTLGREFATWL